MCRVVGGETETLERECYRIDKLSAVLTLGIIPSQRFPFPRSARHFSACFHSKAKYNCGNFRTIESLAKQRCAFNLRPLHSIDLFLCSQSWTSPKYTTRRKRFRRSAFTSSAMTSSRHSYWPISPLFRRSNPFQQGNLTPVIRHQPPVGGGARSLCNAKAFKNFSLRKLSALKPPRDFRGIFNYTTIKVIQRRRIVRDASHHPGAIFSLFLNHSLCVCHEPSSSSPPVRFVYRNQKLFKLSESKVSLCYGNSRC